MRKIKIPSNDSISELKTALNYKSGVPKYKLPVHEEAIIIQLYGKYENLQGVANDDFKSINLIAATNNAIYDAYDETQEDGRLEKLRSRILLSVNRCPLCGISDADELDHHLPRSIYKALSVYSSNLIPICHKCNNKKKTLTGINIEERFTHFYYDNFPSFPLLLVDVSFSIDSLSIRFKINDKGISDLLYKQLNFQIERIALNKRLQKECNVYVCSIGSLLEEAYGENDCGNLKTLLLKQSQDNARIFGINDWRTAFTFSLANCEEFCNGGFKDYLKKFRPQNI